MSNHFRVYPEGVLRSKNFLHLSWTYLKPYASSRIKWGEKLASRSKTGDDLDASENCEDATKAIK